MTSIRKHPGLYEYVAIGLNISELKAQELTEERALNKSIDNMQIEKILDINQREAREIVVAHEKLLEVYFWARRKVGTT